MKAVHDSCRRIAVRISVLLTLLRSHYFIPIKSCGEIGSIAIARRECQLAPLNSFSFYYIHICSSGLTGKHRKKSKTLANQTTFTIFYFIKLQLVLKSHFNCSSI